MKKKSDLQIEVTALENFIFKKRLGYESSLNVILGVL
jgi:hypothetical protein